MIDHERTVLIVDDEAKILNILDLYFRKSGYRVIQASSVSEARSFIETEDIDIIFCDYSLGGSVTGLDLLKELVEKKSDIQKVLMTANSEAKRRFEDEGLSSHIHFLTKPFNSMSQIIKLAEILSETLPDDYAI